MATVWDGKTCSGWEDRDSYNRDGDKVCGDELGIGTITRGWSGDGDQSSSPCQPLMPAQRWSAIPVSTNRQCASRGSNSQPLRRKSETLNTRLPSQKHGQKLSLMSFPLDKKQVDFWRVYSQPIINVCTDNSTPTQQNQISIIKLEDTQTKEKIKINK